MRTSTHLEGLMDSPGWPSFSTEAGVEFVARSLTDLDPSIRDLKDRWGSYLGLYPLEVYAHLSLAYSLHLTF